MKYLIQLFSLLMIVGLVACSPTEDKQQETTTTAADYAANTPKGQASVVDEDSEANILQIAAGSKDHTTLVAAVEAAQIEHVLVNAGPLTVFAPTNAAFAALPEGTVETLLKPENKKQLAYVLTNHAAPSTYKGRLFKDGRKLYMASGEYVEVKKEGEDVFVGGAKILATIDASNGVVHVVDKVILPAEK